MPLDTTTTSTTGTASQIRSAAVLAAFADVGHVGTTAPPRAKGAARAVDKTAWEYYVASVGCQTQESRREKAKRACIAAGLIPDTAINPLPVGTLETVYAGLFVTIGLKVAAQADRTNVPGLVADLLAHIPAKTLNRLVKKHTRSFAGAHIFTASLIE